MSGGSAIGVAIEADRLLKGTLSNLTITLADERYGPPGHNDSNMAQLMSHGFNVSGANILPVLTGQSFEKTDSNFNKLVQQIFNDSDYVIALLGIGADGHTAGLLPGSSVIKSSNMAEGYAGPDYQRITLTPKALIKLDEAVVYTQGEAKKPVLENLDKAIDIAAMPAQILNKINKVTLFNDLRGDNV